MTSTEALNLLNRPQGLLPVRLPTRQSRHGSDLRCSTDVWSVMSTNVDHKYPWIVKHHPVGSEQKDILYEKTRQKKRLVTSDRGGTWRWSSQYDFSPGNCHCCLFPSEWKDHEGCISMTWSLAKVPRDPKGGTRPLLVDPQCVISTRNSTTPIPLGTPKDPVVCHSFPHSAHHLRASLFNLRMKKITAKPGSCQPATMFQWNLVCNFGGYPQKLPWITGSGCFVSKNQAQLGINHFGASPSIFQSHFQGPRGLPSATRCSGSRVLSPRIIWPKSLEPLVGLHKHTHGPWQWTKQKQWQSPQVCSETPTMDIQFGLLEVSNWDPAHHPTPPKIPR